MNTHTHLHKTLLHTAVDSLSMISPPQTATHSSGFLSDTHTHTHSIMYIVLINIIQNSNDICVILSHYTVLFNRNQCVYFYLIEGGRERGVSRHGRLVREEEHIIGERETEERRR